MIQYMISKYNRGIKRSTFMTEVLNFLKPTSSEISSIIGKLKSGELVINTVPERYLLNHDIIVAERNLGLRKSMNRGFDVINNEFFVEEQWILNDPLSPRNTKITFPSFKEYYEFLDGDIYNNACYYQYFFDDDFSKNLNLDMDKLTSVKYFIDKNINDYIENISQEYIDEYKCKEKNKKLTKKWINKFIECDTYSKFKKICNSYKKSSVSQYANLEFFLYQYAYNTKPSKSHLMAIMEYISNDYSADDNTVLGLSTIYNAKDVSDNYDYNQYTYSTNWNKKNNLKKFILEVEANDIEKETRGYFDEKTHFYCEETRIYRYINKNGKITQSVRSINTIKAFETFDDFIEYRKYDLRNCDLSKDIDLDIDFSKCLIDDTTKLPNKKDINLTRQIEKEYNGNDFLVKISWNNELGMCVNQLIFKFPYFFDFVKFLNGDLSNANLIFCDGLKNIRYFDDINFTNSKMTSELCIKFNITYENHYYNKDLIGEFNASQNNENDTSLILQTSRDIDRTEENTFSSKTNTFVQYISDLHLMHKIQNAKCKSKEDIIFTIQKVVGSIVNESLMDDIVLIAGDVSSDFSIFKLFIKLLKKADSMSEFGPHTFLFVLGNHELWDFPDLPFEQVVEKYRMLLQENGMYLLHNDLFYMNEFNDMGIIPFNDLKNLNNSVILDKLKCARLAILGGLGFSGYNEKFNSNSGIYRNVIDRKTEIKETEKFEQLYNKLTPILSKKNTVIFTHTPKSDWCADKNYHDNFVYVSGHTHKNTFYDDGVIRIYADNQIGYQNKNISMKYFIIDNSYEYFKDYDDGIYKISPRDYQNFYRGKNIQMNFNRPVDFIYMLKKNNYYCFIFKGKNGSLSILNGGNLKKLELNYVEYYYDNINEMIAAIQTPLKKFTVYQENIANEIKRIGGTGKIHGCIIDIDYYNHVYINPIDMSITPYFAYDIINKLVYSDISSLLKDKNPKLYCNYIKLIDNKKSEFLLAKYEKNSISKKPQVYLNTDIYKASLEIKKMQRTNSNILTLWSDSALEQSEYFIDDAHHKLL